MKRRAVGMVAIALLAFGVAAVAGPPGLRSDGPVRAAKASAEAKQADRSSPEAPTLSGTVAGPASGAAPVYDPCPGHDGAIAGEGPSIAQAVTIPAVVPEPLSGAAKAFDPLPGEVPASYAGTIVRPADEARYPGSRPAVVLLHGIDGDQCQMWWLAQYLSGSGYVTLTLTSPTPPEHDASYGVAIDAARSAVRFLSTPLENPMAFATDANDLGLAGWSEGSVVASVSQGLPDMESVKAIVALDDLRGSFLGDTGAPETFCSPPVEATVDPRVPALGFASDTACDVEPTDTRPDIKLSGFSRWYHAAVPAVELPLAGYGHFDYAAIGHRLIPVGTFTLAWFNGWLDGQSGALGAFTACHLDGLATPATLSSTFHSAVYLPSLGIGSTTWARDLANRCHLDPSVIGTRPVPPGT